MSGVGRPFGADRAILRVTRLGADGDGLAPLPDGTTVYIAGALPGELVQVRRPVRRGEGWAADLVAVIEPAAERAPPPCPRFGACGGCVAQHMNEAAYVGWKTALVATAPRRAGFADVALAPLARTGAGERRRMDLALRRTGGAIVVGLHRARSDSVVDLTVCLVLHPVLVALIAPLRALLAGFGGLRRSGSAVVNLLDTGADLLLRGDGPVTLSDRLALTAFARAHALSRVSWARDRDAPEPVCVFRPTTVTFSGVSVTLPPGGFLQASARGERAIVAAVLAGLPSPLPARARIGELYAGCGTLTFALADRARVSAFEGDPDACVALMAAARRDGRVTAFRRDLARQPLREVELAEFAAVVLDPPHAGAPAQMAAIGASRVARVIYVSCDPAALARDAAILGKAGYGWTSLTPIDQFPWSARVESVAVFRVGPRRN